MGIRKGGDAERVRRELGGTCHNDKRGRNYGNAGGVGVRMRGGKQVGRRDLPLWQTRLCTWGGFRKKGDDGEEEVGRCEWGGTCHNDKPGLNDGDNGGIGIRKLVGRRDPCAWGNRKGGDGEEEVRRCEWGRTCHNDKPGLNDGDNGGIGIRMRGRSWLESGTCHNGKPGHVCGEVEKGGVM